MPIIGDVAHVLEDLLKVWKSRGAKTDAPGHSGTGGSQIEEWRKVDCLKFEQKGKVIRPQHAIARLEALTKDHPNRYICTEVGQHQMWAAQYMGFNEPNRWMTSPEVWAPWAMASPPPSACRWRTRTRL